MLRRTKEKVTEKHIGDELQEGFDHFRSAAALAAERAAERIAPAVESARQTARERVGPQIEHAREAATQAWESRVRSPATETADSAVKMSRRARRKARKAGMEAGRRTRKAAGRLRGEEPPKRRRWRWMLGAVGIGAAIGAAGALISRRRASEWEEYESQPGGAVGSGMPTGSAPMGGADTTTGGPPRTAREKVTDMADAAKRKAGEAVNTVREKAASTASENARTAQEKAMTAKKRVTETPPSEPAVTGPTVRPGPVPPPEDRPPGT